MAALPAAMASVIEKCSLKSEKYLNSKSFYVTTFVKDQETGELEVKIQIPYNQHVL